MKMKDYGFWLFIIFVAVVTVPFFYKNAGELIQFFILLILVKYTIETQLLREGSLQREVPELRGYFGYFDKLKMDADGGFKQSFKNSGKTPLVLHRAGVVKFVKHSDGTEYVVPQNGMHSSSVLNPGQVITSINSSLPAVENEGRRLFYVLFEAEYSTYEGSRYIHMFKINLENGFVINEEEHVIEN